MSLLCVCSITVQFRIPIITLERFVVYITCQIRCRHSVRPLAARAVQSFDIYNNLCMDKNINEKLTPPPLLKDRGVSAQDQ